MSNKIIKNKNVLHKKTSPVMSLDEGEKIANELIEILKDTKHGIGLTANQIGIPKAVCVIWARRDQNPVILMNPVITEKSDEKIVYLEGCLSLPGKQVTTLRSQKVTVVTMNHANPVHFGPDVFPITQESVGSDYGVLEAICVQHEIDHTLGVLITDQGVRHVSAPKQKEVKHGRNDKVVVEKSGQTQYIKYKKALELVVEGWKII